MAQDDFNPYAPPQERSLPESPALASGKDRYRIEKNIFIVHPPFELPVVCFLTGQQHELQQIEIPLRVMPKWWNYAMALMMFTVQMVVMFSGFALQKLNLSGWFALPMVAPVIIGFGLPALSAIGVLYFSKRITLTAYWNDSCQVFQKRQYYVIYAMLFDGVVLAALFTAYLFEVRGVPMFVMAAISMVVGFLVTLGMWIRNRKPWSRLGAHENSDGSLSIYGLEASFLARCRVGFENMDSPSTINQLA